MPARRNDTVRLRPADPFDLIRWLARSQSDPRKAVAELVQNSLDARATHVRLARRRHRGVTVLTIHDDGEGVIPELSREEALRYLATHIGHSRKRQLTPQERARQVIAGQYGVGLLGFWSIGRHLELRSRVEGSEVWSLKLEEDRALGAIGRIATPIGAPRTYTELVVSGVHATAQRLVGGRKLADYLGSELRGQLLARGVVLEVHDASARGLAQKDFRVVPRRFEGERLSLPEEIEVPGYPPARLELYLAPTAELAGVQVACRGTLVADDVRELGTLGLDGPPWVGRQLRGLVDFSGFEVPPGTRRGVRPDRAALAFAEALQSLAPAVEAELARLDRERTVASDRETARQLRRALRGFHRRFPQYELPEVDQGREADGERHGEQPGVPPAPEPPVEPAPVLELFPPGPPVTVEIVPAVVEVPVGGERRVQAVARFGGAGQPERGMPVDGPWPRLQPGGGGRPAGHRGGGNALAGRGGRARSGGRRRVGRGHAPGRCAGGARERDAGASRAAPGLGPRRALAQPHAGADLGGQRCPDVRLRERLRALQEGEQRTKRFHEGAGVLGPRSTLLGTSSNSASPRSRGCSVASVTPRWKPARSRNTEHGATSGSARPSLESRNRSRSPFSASSRAPWSSSSASDRSARRSIQSRGDLGKRRKGTSAVESIDLGMRTRQH